MAIDITSEKLIRLRDVPALAWLPPRRAGGKLAFSTLWTWAVHGRKGIKLETVPVGASMATSEAALLRFFERGAIPGGDQNTVTPGQRKKSHEQAMKKLKAAGIVK